MINAIEAKLMTDEVKENYANEWCKEFLPKLEEEIIKQINCRCYCLIIDNDHKLNDTRWINNDYLRNKVLMEIESLNYKFRYSGAGTGCLVEIIWE